MPRFRTNVSRVSVSICVIANRCSGRNRSLTRSKAAAATSIATSAAAWSGLRPSSSVRYACAASASVAITSVTAARPAESVLESLPCYFGGGGSVVISSQELRRARGLPYVERSLDHRKKVLVYARVAVEFGMKRRCRVRCPGAPSRRGRRARRAPRPADRALDPGRADEDRGETARRRARESKVRPRPNRSAVRTRCGER